ncbi:MAG: hypothetical protein ACTSWY_11655 [Promethearchaeota archaeon]
MWLLDTNMLILFSKNSKNLPFFKKGFTYTTIFSIVEYPVLKLLKNITIFYPSSADYTESIKNAIKLRKKGTPIPSIDILIGTITVNKNFNLVSEDKHFKIFEAIEPRLKRINSNVYMQEIQKIKVKE